MERETADIEFDLERRLDALLHSLFDCLAQQYEVSILSYSRCRVRVVLCQHIVAEIHLGKQRPNQRGYIRLGERFSLMNLIQMVEAVYCFYKLRVFVNGNLHYHNSQIPHSHLSYVLVAYNVKSILANKPTENDH